LTLLLVLCAFGAAAAGCGSSPAAVPHVHRHIALVGFNDNSVAQGLVSPAADAALTAQTGANAVRVTLDWASVERVPGRFDFSWADALYQAMSARHVRILWIPMFAPRWAAGLQCPPWPLVCHAPPTPAHDGDWRAFITRLAERYPRSAGIEVWNEPNLVTFWQPRPSPARYEELLAEAYAAVKRVAPSLPVVSGGLGDGPPQRAGDIPLHGYLQSMLADGAASHMDALGIHPYPAGSDESAFIAAMRDAQSLLSQYGRPRLPVWITEIGLTTTGPEGVSPSTQASVLRDLYRRAEALPDVHAIFFHTLLDPPGPLSNPEVGYGIFRSAGVPKPAAADVRRLFRANRRLRRRH
jgi:hypothetical protein